MIIIIKRLPANTHLSDIYEFIAPALKRSFPFRSGQVLKTEILVLRDKHTNQYEFYGLVNIEPENACRRAIDKLKSKRFKNKLVIVKEYFNRDWHNDKRGYINEVSTDILEKRSGDRRRGNQLEAIKDASSLFKAVDQARKLI